VNDAIVKALKPMLNSEIRNYIAPGLSSFLVGGEGFGRVRLFASELEQVEHIIPHSHRFDFTCLVLEGSVVNTLYTQPYMAAAQKFALGMMRRTDRGMGDYEVTPGRVSSCWESTSTQYAAGDTYSMTAEEIHSIRFSRGARVLFFEGPETTRTSQFLEPWAYGARVPTFATQPWMFERP
jgi:hypothetical protein